MKIKPIRTNNDYKAALARVEQLMDIETGTEEADELEILTVLINAYEQTEFPINQTHPIDAIRFRMQQLNLQNKDLIPYIGQSSRVSEVLNKRRPLSINMIRNLHEGLNIPLESLIKKYALIKDVKS